MKSTRRVDLFTKDDGAPLLERRMSYLDMAARDIRANAEHMWGDSRRKEIARAAAMQREVAVIRDWLRQVKKGS